MGVVLKSSTIANLWTLLAGYRCLHLGERFSILKCHCLVHVKLLSSDKITTDVMPHTKRERCASHLLVKQRWPCISHIIVRKMDIHVEGKGEEVAPLVINRRLWPSSPDAGLIARNILIFAKITKMYEPFFLKNNPGGISRDLQTTGEGAKG